MREGKQPNRIRNICDKHLISAYYSLIQEEESHVFHSRQVSIKDMFTTNHYRRYVLMENDTLRITTNVIEIHWKRMSFSIKKDI